MKKKTKRLEIKINSCYDCPYSHDPIIRDGIYCQLISEYQFISDHTIKEKSFPNWCPIDNKNNGVKAALSAIMIRDGEVLLGKRKNTDLFPNTWAFPGGKMDYGETPEDGICREIFEETGIEVDIDNLIFLTYQNEFFPEHNQHYVTLYFIILNPLNIPEVMEPDKCEEWKWYDPFDLPENTFWGVKSIIQEKKELIKSIIIEQEKQKILDEVKK